MRSKQILIIFIIICFLITPIKPKAEEKTFGDVLDRLEELKEQKKDKENETAISEAEYERIKNEIYQIEKDIAKLSKEIQEATEEIAKLEKDIESKKEETDNILVFLQLSNGEKSYLEYVFKAKSFTDFIHRVSVVEQLSKYNKEQIQEMNNMINRNNELKKQNAEKIKKQEAKKIESNKKMQELGSKIETLVGDATNINDEIKAKENDIERYRNDGCKNRSDLLSDCSPMVTATGFLRPLKYGRITSEYGYRVHPVTGALQSFHSGIDIGGNSEGTEVYPVANGVVLYKMYRSSCGGNRLYIKHNVNGKEYTSVYMHLLSFGDIKEGDIVKYDQVIGYVGGYSTSTSHGGYDTCTTGAHLHLTLARGHTVNHTATMFNPREMIVFPTSGTFNTRTF